MIKIRSFLERIFFIFEFMNPILYITVASLISFLVLGFDKYKARKRQRRIPENTLLLISLFGGSIGSAIGMLMFNHKTSKRNFLIKFFLIIIVQMVLFYLFK